MLITQDILAGPGIRDKPIYVDPARTDCVIGPDRVDRERSDIDAHVAFAR